MLDLGLHEVAEVMAHDAVVRQTLLGQLAEIEGGGIVNSGAAGEVVLWASRRTADATLAKAFERQVRWITTEAPRADDGTIFHITGTREVWVDSVYMVVPLLVLAGKVDEALRQLIGHAERLQDAGSGLYAHMWDEDSGRLTRAAHWGTGNGWVVAGLARALHLLGDGNADFAAYAQRHARSVIDACLEHRRPDGLFHDVVDDSSTFIEANVAQMLAYATLTGAADGWLPPQYADIGLSLLATARSQIGPAGFVEGVCGAPRFDRQGRSAEAQSFFLLATAAARRVTA